MKPSCALLTRFKELSIQRVASGRSAIRDEADLASTQQALHSMAGEAGLLGVVEVMALARAAEQAASEHARARSPESKEAFECALGDLETALRNALRDMPV